MIIYINLKPTIGATDIAKGRNLGSRARQGLLYTLGAVNGAEVEIAHVDPVLAVGAVGENGAATRIAIHFVYTSATVLARIGGALVDVVRAVLAIVARLASALVVVHLVGA